MSGSVNKVILIGHAGKDPEIRRLSNGDPVASLRLATSESWRDKQTGERKEKTEWHSIVIFNENITKTVESYVRKGSKLYIEGALQTREWTDKDGIKKYSTEVVLQKFRGELTLLDGAKREESAAPNPENEYAKATGGSISQRAMGARGAAFDDEVPF